MEDSSKLQESANPEYIDTRLKALAEIKEEIEKAIASEMPSMYVLGLARAQNIMEAMFSSFI